MSSNQDWSIGLHAVSELLKQRPSDVLKVVIQAGRKDKRLVEIKQLAQQSGIALEELNRAQIDQQCGGTHQGAAALCQGRQVTGSEQELLQLLDSLKTDALLLVLDSVTDPHNLGACLRSADAAGVDAVIIPKDKSASLNATVRKVASGAAETVNLVTVTNLVRCLENLKKRGIWVVGTADGTEKSLFDQDLKGSIALVMGSEGAGLRRLTRQHCDFLVAIPMAGELSSLNVSVAAGIALFEAVRQRGK